MMLKMMMSHSRRRRRIWTFTIASITATWALLLMTLLLGGPQQTALATATSKDDGGGKCVLDKCGMIVDVEESENTKKKTKCSCMRTCHITKNCCDSPKQIDKVCNDGKPYVIRSILDDKDAFHLVKALLLENKGVHVADAHDAEKTLAKAALDSIAGITKPVCKNVCLQLLMLKKKLAIVSRVQQAFLLESFFLWRTKWKALQTARAGLAAHRLVVMPVLDTPLARRVARDTASAALEAATQAAAEETGLPIPPPPPTLFDRLKNWRREGEKKLRTTVEKAAQFPFLPNANDGEDGIITLPWAFDAMRKAIGASTGLDEFALAAEQLAQDDVEEYEGVTARFHNHTLSMFDVVIGEPARLASTLASVEEDVRAAESSISIQEKAVTDMLARARRLEGRVAEAMAQASRMATHMAEREGAEQP